MDPYLIAYFVGYVFMFRKIAGAMAYTMSYDGEPDAEDYVLGLIMAFCSSFFWPPILIGWSMFYLAKRYGNGMNVLFPKPKPIETRSEREARIAAEQKAQIKERQKQINAAERENGLPLTEWNRSY